MKVKIAFITLFAGILSGCDPSATQVQIVKNSSGEEIILYRFPDSMGVFTDTFNILAGEEKEVFNFSELGELSEESCPKLNYLTYVNDSIFMVSKSGKPLKKDWFDENNWKSQYKNKIGTNQKCTFEVFDTDF